MAEAAHLLKSSPQLITWGIDIIWKTGELESAPISWSTRTVAEHIWDNFKTNFSASHQRHVKDRSLSMRGTMFNHSSTTVSTLTGQMVTTHCDLVNSINSLYLWTSDVLVSSQLLSDIDGLHHQLTMLHENSPIKESSQDRTSSNRTTIKNSSSYRLNKILNCCWSHRAWSHSSTENNNKKPGHLDADALANKLNGSIAYLGSTQSMS